MKTVLYCFAAVIIGLLLVFGPLLVIGYFESDQGYEAQLITAERLQNMEKATYGSAGSSEFVFDFEILAICVVIALAAYLLVKRLF
ncbi:MAG: hypothetical protein QXJ94_03120 [Candidatus Bathyarchaeia archaeon]